MRLFGIGVLFVLLSVCSNGGTNNPDGIPDGLIIETVARGEDDDELDEDLKYARFSP